MVVEDNKDYPVPSNYFEINKDYKTPIRKVEIKKYRMFYAKERFLYTEPLQVIRFHCCNTQMFATINPLGLSYMFWKIVRKKSFA